MNDFVTALIPLSPFLLPLIGVVLWAGWSHFKTKSDIAQLEAQDAAPPPEKEKPQPILPIDRP